MKIRLTPLNIISAGLLVGSAYLFIFQDREGWRLLGTIPMLMMAFICFITDLVFRWKIASLKRIWIVEIAFIIFVLLLIVGIRMWD